MASERETAGLVENANKKILSLSDIHFPFALEDELKIALETHSDADIVVLNGDIFNRISFSLVFAGTGLILSPTGILKK